MMKLQHLEFISATTISTTTNATAIAASIATATTTTTTAASNKQSLPRKQSLIIASELTYPFNYIDALII